MEESPTHDFESPYYIDPDWKPHENLPMTILSYEEDNYVLWKLDFLRFLRIKNKTAFVDGTLEKPDPSSPLYKPWKQCNERVKCWLMNSMTDKVLTHVLLAKTAQKMWEGIRHVFVPNFDLKIRQTRQKIATMKQEDGESVAKYFKKVKRVWMELSEYDPVAQCSCRGCKCEVTKRAKEAREKEERCAFLMGLNESFTTVKTIIMFKKPLPSIYQAYAMVKQAEESMMNFRR